MPHAAFDVSDELDGQAVLHVSGEIDASARSQFQARLDAKIEGNDDDVVVDLADVSFIDSSGLAVLLYARHQLDAGGRKLLIARPSPAVITLFEVAGVDAVFDKRG